MRASIISVGNELTNGQILNKNAQWIAKRLNQFGLLTDFQVTVADDHSSIEKALNLCVNTDLLFITGGLGPTSDDFTREVVAKWAGVSLEFHEPSWQRIQNILNARKIPVRDMQKQQCYFPPHSQILENSAGTANGFLFSHQKQVIIVLPGPPKEISAIWSDHLHSFLTEKTKTLDPWMTLSWDTMGLGESEIAFKTEEALKNINIEKSYRVHLPYVEVKLSFLKSQSASFASSIANLDLALLPWTLLKNGEDPTELLFEELKIFSLIQFQDLATDGLLLERLHEQLKKSFKNQKIIFSNETEESNDDLISKHSTTKPFEKNYFLFSITNHENKIQLNLASHLEQVERKTSLTLNTPYDFVLDKNSNNPAQSIVSHERRLLYATELSIIEAYKFLADPKKESF